MSPERTAPAPLPAADLRWHCDPGALHFKSTAEVEPITGVIGQDSAVEALRFGLETSAPGQNIFVRGLTGTGRMTLVKRLMEEIRPSCPAANDRCYVHNFGQPDQPRLITLDRGQARSFARRIDQLADFIRNDLPSAFSSEGIKSRREALDQSAQEQLEKLMKPFNEALQEAGLALVTAQAGQVTQTGIFPLHEGKPIPPEEFDQLRARGEVSQEHYDAIRKRQAEFEQQLSDLGEQVNDIRKSHQERVRALFEASARVVLHAIIRDIKKDFPADSVATFLDELLEDVVSERLGQLEGDAQFTLLYRVNIVLEHKPDTGCPIVIENAPAMRNLLGSIGYDHQTGERPQISHMGIRPGSLLKADGGYLILDARDVLSEPGAWKVLVRTLRTGRLEISPADMFFPFAGPSLKPEPIDVHVKVVLLSDTYTYYLLDQYDPDFPELFKVLADFDSTIARDTDGALQYARVLARIAGEEKLPAFDAAAVAALVEHGARVAARRGKLTAQFGRLADIAREAAFIATKADRKQVSAADVQESIRRRKRRADLPARRFREYVADGTIRVQTEGSAVGQVNGLAVLQAGPMVYGFPARITATIGPGTAGVINIDRESALSGAIHTKGFYILGGLMRRLLRTDHPLAFDASVAFEQSYGGIDGDSASGAEICCLLSALTEVPLRQDLAMTGAIDQVGNILPIGGVNEKIEGFFDTCKDIGLTGTQGVVIPQANAGDLMLRSDVVEACADGRFHVYAVRTIHEAIELFTGMPAGQLDREGQYAEGTFLALADQQARVYWRMAAQPLPARKRAEDGTQAQAEGEDVAVQRRPPGGSAST